MNLKYTCSMALFGSRVILLMVQKSQTNHLRLVVYLSIPLWTGFFVKMVFVDHKTWKTRSVNDSVFVFFGNPLLIYQKLD